MKSSKFFVVVVLNHPTEMQKSCEKNKKRKRRRQRLKKSKNTTLTNISRQCTVYEESQKGQRQTNKKKKLLTKTIAICRPYNSNKFVKKYFYVSLRIFILLQNTPNLKTIDQSQKQQKQTWNKNLHVSVK